jgi:hypothetical protein
MIPAQCACGFTELDDETITDHLHLVFTPDDIRGKDGLVHEEGERLACFCGFTARTPDELDQHFRKVFTPDDAVGPDGKKHGPAGAS